MAPARSRRRPWRSRSDPHGVLVDTHCHLADPAFDTDRAAVIARAGAAGVGHIVVIATSADDGPQVRALTAAHGLSATAGVHPHEADSWTGAVPEQIAVALDDPAVVAVGETGLDYHYEHAPRTAQRAAFEAQLALAADHALPAVVHARDADDDMSAIIRAWAGRVTLVLHSFSAGRAVFDAGLEARAYFGWSGMVTFRSWALQELVAACPEDRLLVETDAPYLAPVPHRGKRNEPAWVGHVAAAVARSRGRPVETVAAQSTANAVRCFGPRVTHHSHRTEA